MKHRIIALFCFFLLCISTFYGCCKSQHYNVKHDELSQYLWDNCLAEVFDGKLIFASHHYREENYLYFSCYLPNDMEFEQVKEMLEELKQKVLSECSNKTFEPCCTFLLDGYTTVYVELINPRRKYPNDYPRVAGRLKIDTKYFPAVEENEKLAVSYY